MFAGTKPSHMNFSSWFTLSVFLFKGFFSNKLIDISFSCYPHYFTFSGNFPSHVNFQHIWILITKLPLKCIWMLIPHSTEVIGEDCSRARISPCVKLSVCLPFFLPFFFLLSRFFSPSFLAYLGERPKITLRHNQKSIF